MIDAANDIAQDRILEADICIVGADPAGTRTALELSGQGRQGRLLEAKLEQAEEATHAVYDGEVADECMYSPLEKYHEHRLSGPTTIRGRRCIPFDPIDFEARDYIPHSGWPITHADEALLRPDQRLPGGRRVQIRRPPRCGAAVRGLPQRAAAHRRARAPLLPHRPGQLLPPPAGAGARHVRRISAHRPRLISSPLGTPLTLLERASIGRNHLPPGIPPSLLRLWTHEIPLDPGCASACLIEHWPLYADLLTESTSSLNAPQGKCI